MIATVKYQGVSAYRAALNFISQQQRTVRNVLIPFMRIIKGPDRDPTTPSTCYCRKKKITFFFCDLLFLLFLKSLLNHLKSLQVFWCTVVLEPLQGCHGYRLPGRYLSFNFGGQGTLQGLLVHRCA